MFSQRRVGRKLMLAALCAALAACSMHSTLPEPSSSARSDISTVRDTFSPTAFGNWVYTCAIGPSTCPLYTLSGTKPTYKSAFPITGKPSSSFATSAGKWYVVLRSKASVVVYNSTAAGPTGPTATLSDPGESTVDVAVNATDKVVAVAHLYPES